MLLKQILAMANQCEDNDYRNFRLDIFYEAIKTALQSFCWSSTILKFCNFEDLELT